MGKNWVDWTDFMAGKVGEPEHPLSKPVTTGPTLRKGEIPYRPTDEEIRRAILHNAPKQPTDEQMFGHLVVTDEMVAKAEEEFNSRFTKFFRTDHKPLEKNQNPTDWGNRGPVDHKDRSQLTEEEQRISEIPVDPSYLSGD